MVLTFCITNFFQTVIKGSVLYGMCFKKKKKKVSKFVCLTSIDSRLTRTCEGVGRPPKTDSKCI